MMTNNEIREAMENYIPEVKPIVKPEYVYRNKDATEKCEQEIPVDIVNHPPHYQSKSGLEVIDVIEAFTDNLKGIYAVDTGNAIKYICRWSHKNGVEDLKKARWYINNLINHLEKEGEK